MAWTSGGRLPVWFGEYLLEKRIGLGGMAEVYRGARSGGFETPLAVKILHHHLCEDAAFVEQFLKEARIAALLDHPNIVRFHEVGELDGRYFIAMELVDGVDLSKVVAFAARRGRALSVSLAALIASHALAGLSHAHAWTDRDGNPYRIVHGDLSPSNILLSREGLLTILDFGLAQAVAGTLRGAKGLRGKFAYMAPEQVRERPVDERTDIFAMGAVLFEMVTGVRLFEGPTDLATLEKVDRAEVPAASSLNPAVPPIVDELLRQAMAREPADRFATADAMRAALLALRRHGVPMATTADLEELVSAVASEEEGLDEERAKRRSSHPEAVEIIPLQPKEASEGDAPLPAAVDAGAPDPLAALESMLMGGGEAATAEERSEELETLDGDELEEISEEESPEPPHALHPPPPVPRDAMVPPTPSAPAPAREERDGRAEAPARDAETAPPTDAKAALQGAEAAAPEPGAQTSNAEAAVARLEAPPVAAPPPAEADDDTLEPDFDGFMDAVDALIEEQRAAEKRRASRPPRPSSVPARRSSVPPAPDGGNGSGT